MWQFRFRGYGLLVFVLKPSRELFAGLEREMLPLVLSIHFGELPWHFE
jgi:hypothetical protein